MDFHMQHLWLGGLQRESAAQGIHRLGARLEAGEAAGAQHLHQQQDAVRVLPRRQEPAYAQHLPMQQARFVLRVDPWCTWSWTQFADAGAPMVCMFMNAFRFAV
jgi:hypothetical protein